MESIISILSPEQVDTILAVYGTVTEWYVQAVDFITTQASNIVIEDMYL